MKLNSVGEIVASRDLQVAGSNQRVRISIGKPERFPAESEPFPVETDYYCPYQIIGFGKEKIGHAGGIDSIQALMLALERVGIELYTSAEAKSGLLSWDGALHGNFGLPVSASVADLVPDPN